MTLLMNAISTISNKPVIGLCKWVRAYHRHRNRF